MTLSEALRRISAANDDEGPGADTNDRREPEPRPEPLKPTRNWSGVRVGKYGEGALLTLPQIMFRNADWFFHCYETGVFGRSPFGASLLYAEASLIYKRSTAIRLKPGDAVEYLVARDRFEDLRFHSAHSAPPRSSSVIDMRFPRLLKKFDTAGYRIFIGSIVEYFFGKRLAMTKRRAEAFFSDESRFVNP